MKKSAIGIKIFLMSSNLRALVSLYRPRRLLQIFPCLPNPFALIHEISGWSGGSVKVWRAQPCHCIYYFLMICPVFIPNIFFLLMTMIKNVAALDVHVRYFFSLHFFFELEHLYATKVILKIHL